MIIKDLISIQEYNQWAEERKTVLEVLTILNNRHREQVAEAMRPPTQEQRETDAIAWLVKYQESWYGPRSEWTEEQHHDFRAHAGFLMMYLGAYVVPPQPTPE
jgi:hypothetical protein